MTELSVVEVFSHRERAGLYEAPLSPEPAADFDEKDVICGARKHAAYVAAEAKLSGIVEILTLLGPGDMKRGTKPPFPPKDRVESERLEVEVRIERHTIVRVEFEAMRA